MILLYTADKFVVVAVHYSPTDLGYEVVDKENHKAVFLTGHAAVYFERQLVLWKENPPGRDTVEDAFEGLLQLGAQTTQDH